MWGSEYDRAGTVLLSARALEVGPSWTRFFVGKPLPTENVLVGLSKGRLERISDRKLEVEAAGVGKDAW